MNDRLAESPPAAVRDALDGMPEPLLRVAELVYRDDHPFRKVHRLIDAIEVLVKLHTVAVVSDYFSRDDLSAELKGMLAAGLRTPSLGIWWLFCREVARQMDRDGLPFFVTGARGFILGQGARREVSLTAALDRDDSLINFRNSYAHGATPTDDVCRADLATQLPRFEALLIQASHLRRVRLELEKDGRVKLISDDGRGVDLHPLLVYKPEEQRYYFYNDVRKPKASFLNYEAALNWRSRELLDDLLARYQIDEWSRIPAEGFRERIEELTETFKGRRKELATLRTFLERPRGFLMVWGSPGVGKSALLAQAVRELAWSGPAGSEPARALVVEYFIRRGQRTDQADFFLANLNRRIEEAVPTGVAQGRSRSEQWDNFDARLHAASARLGARKLLLVIDGLDEACGEGNDLLRYLPRTVPQGVLVVYAARPLPEVRKGAYEQLDRENRSEMVLAGLSPADTRALLYDYVSKYDLADSYVRAVAERSGGNPLFLKMLCESLAAGDLPLNDLARLPSSMERLYAELLSRLRKVDRVLDLLLLLTAAQDSVSASTLAGMTGWTLAQAEETFEAALEVLLENPLTVGVIDYQLFHESLRDYLKQRYAAEVARWHRRLADWCAGWAERGSDAKVYALKYGVRHLEALRQEGDGGALAAMRRRVEDRDFRAAQYIHCGARFVLDDLLRVARAIFEQGGGWRSAFPLLLLHAREGRRMQGEEMTRLVEHARAGNIERVQGALAKERDPLARFVATLLAAWELADAGRPFLETLLDAEKVPGVGLPARALGVFDQILAGLEGRGLARADADRLLASALAAGERQDPRATLITRIAEAMNDGETETVLTLLKESPAAMEGLRRAGTTKSP